MGWLTSTLILGALGLAADRAAVRIPGLERGIPRVLAGATLAWTWATLGAILLGVAGFLSGPGVALWTLLGLAAIFLPRKNGADSAKPAPTSAEPPDAWARLGLGLTLWPVALLGGVSLWQGVKVVSDGPIYHLYFASRWWQEGRLSIIWTPFGESAAPYFPAGGDVWMTWLIAAFGGDRLARVGQAPFLLMASIAAAGLSRLLGAGRSASTLAACLFASVMPLMLFSFEPNVDTIFVAGYLTAVYFLVRHLLRDEPGSWSNLLLGGLAAGGALGTKPTALVFVPPLLLLGLLTIWRTRRRKPTVAETAAWLGGAAVPSTFWFARNLWLTGNPLYPLHLRVLGRTILHGWYDRAAMQSNPLYAIPITDGAALADILLAVSDPRLVPFWLAALLGAWSIGGRGRVSDRVVWALAILALLNIASYWLLIPYRTQQRFMLQAYGLAAVPLAILLDRSSLLRALACLGLLVHLVTPMDWPFGSSLWDFSPLIPSRVPPMIAIPLTPGGWFQALGGPQGAGLLLALLIVAPSLGIGIAWGRPSRRGVWTPLLLISLIAWSGLATWRAWPASSPTARFDYYPRFDFLPGWLALDRLVREAPGPIAYAGTNLPYYLMGPDLSRVVRHVHINAHSDWAMHDYHRQAIARGKAPVETTRPGWDREEQDVDAWLENLEREKIVYLVVTRANPLEGPHDVADPENFPVERQWADARPEQFPLVHGPAQGDPIFRVYRVIRGNTIQDR